MRERRHYVRANGLVLVNYKVPKLNLEGKSSAFDISGSGVRITAERQLKNGTLVEMEIYLPGSSQPIVAKGEVTWVRNCPAKADTKDSEKKEYSYIGIKFSFIDEENKTRIIDYVHRKVHRG